MESNLVWDDEAGIWFDPEAQAAEGEALALAAMIEAADLASAQTAETFEDSEGDLICEHCGHLAVWEDDERPGDGGPVCQNPEECPGDLL